MQKPAKIQTNWYLLVPLFAVLLVVIGVLWYLVYQNGWGSGDFSAYWSAAYLLAHGQDVYAMENMRAVQENLVGTDVEYVVMVWNPPILFAFLLPLALLTFPAARATWLIVNIGIVFLACVLLGRVYFPHRPKRFLLLCVLAFLFPPVLTGLAMGQVTFLLLLGTAACLYFYQRENWFWAGFSLIFLAIKPQIVVLPALYLGLVFILNKRWQAILGLVSAGLVLVLALFAVRPAWMMDYLGLLAIAPTNWLTPTLGGILEYYQVTRLGSYLIFLLIPLAVYMAFRRPVRPEWAVPLLVVLTVPFTFFGWSYDHSILLVPLAFLIAEVSAAENRVTRILFAASLAVLLVLNWIQRLDTPEDVFYFWVPLTFAALYLGILTLSNRRPVIDRRVPAPGE